MEKIKDYLFLHLSIMIFSFTSVFSKMASQEFNAGGLKNYKVYLFIFLMILVCFVYAICWQKIIKKFDLHIGFANRSVYLIWSQIWAVSIFGEHLSARNVIGLFVVLAGVIIVALNGETQ